MLTITLLGALAAASAYYLYSPSPPSEQLLAQAREGLAAKDFVAVEALSRRVLSRQPQSTPALLLAGEAATKLGRLQDALAYYEQIPTESGPEAALGYAAAGEILLHLHQASAAEAKLRIAILLDPQQVFAHNRLGYLLGIEGRRWESIPHLFEVLRHDQFSTEVLLLLGNHEATIELPDELARYRKAAPDDPLPLLGLARIAMSRDRMDEARQMLDKVLAARPDLLEAQAELGQLLVASGDPALSNWIAELPPTADEHPEIWVARGMWCKNRGDYRGAVRCFWETLERAPNHQAATYQLAQMLELAGEPSLAKRFGDRAIRLQKLCGTMDLLFHNRNDMKLLRAAAELTESVGCLWEAWGWHRVLLTIDPQAAWARQGLARLQSQLDDQTPLVVDAANLAKGIDLSRYDVPAWQSGSPEILPPRPAAAESASVTFEDSTKTAGIRFSYFAGNDTFEQGRRIFQITGGGVAVLDFDGDNWPDIFFTQGCPWPPSQGQTKYLDRLYRNLGDGRFEDVTLASGLSEDRFGQGVSVGDFNNDGFPDLYVANIGKNRLFMNQGDGSFRDISAESGIETDQWTTSCVLADLNGDGLADIYDVNYVQGEDIFTKVCYQKEAYRSCSPTVFEPQPDRFCLNLGNGRFEDRTAAAGMDVPGGNGLGVLAADFDGSGRVSLFVANDQDANFYFVNSVSRSGGPRFLEQGVLSGLAYDGEGKAQACMGVAAGDANGDGKLDLFVTNFYQEPNTLYLQELSSLFVDATARAGLRAPSYDLLGFGVQFIDGELDGRPDLVLANGHVDDFSQQNIPYEMPPQYFRNLGDGRFMELPAANLGEFFQGKYLGRGMARLDSNRDGREDFVVSHLASPAALITNATEQHGHFLAIQLRGVQSSRDAIGAIVTLTAAGKTYRQWLTAGDGYQASNQRQLVFGLGPQQRVEELKIHWPSGREQQFSDLAADQELIFVENSPRITQLTPAR